MPAIPITVPNAKAFVSIGQSKSAESKVESSISKTATTAPSQIKSATTLAPERFRLAASTPSAISTSKTIALGSHESLAFPPAPGYVLKRTRRMMRPLAKQSCRNQWRKTCRALARLLAHIVYARSQSKMFSMKGSGTNKNDRAAKLFLVCPLCGQDNVESNSRLEDHVAGYLRSLALKSLPSYHEDILDEDQNGNDSIEKHREAVETEDSKDEKPEGSQKPPVQFDGVAWLEYSHPLVGDKPPWVLPSGYGARGSPLTLTAESTIYDSEDDDPARSSSGVQIETVRKANLPSIPELLRPKQETGDFDSSDQGPHQTRQNRRRDQGPGITRQERERETSASTGRSGGVNIHGRGLEDLDRCNSYRPREYNAFTANSPPLLLVPANIPNDRHVTNPPVLIRTWRTSYEQTEDLKDVRVDDDRPSGVTIDERSASSDSLRNRFERHRESLDDGEARRLERLRRRIWRESEGREDSGSYRWE
ncbi:uncharacterized protein B0J16DRAFT_392720 [Fusarium flagelliforme]|uniref:uncharacterized protein n=1 Tax=Fusarium flagelliforme TaxID=2675880 RepID=UPI001E8D03A6|nr:uncharacterized protein B0J16DRAFT_392720 [Fusarium flagelliforme]KAH7198904.1 hypothetical protein B0J16DRAFT_392720 [Fusarium flagelliforme]